VIARCDGDADAVPRTFGKAGVGEFFPGGALVGGFVDPGIRFVGAVFTGEKIGGTPERGVEDARIFGVGFEVGDTGEIVLVESFLPGFAAVGSFVDAAIGAGWGNAEERMAEDAYVDDVRIFGIYDDRADVFRFFQADVGPGGAGVGGFVDAVAGSLLAGADVDDFGIRWSNGDRADGGDVLLVENREPDFTCVGGFPDATAM
jgi:hypothetical protein